MMSSFHQGLQSHVHYASVVLPLLPSHSRFNRSGDPLSYVRAVRRAAIWCYSAYAFPSFRSPLGRETTNPTVPVELMTSVSDFQLAAIAS
ncbi:hypothetical protein DPEC_G00301050 [Dallia pectoralis]|uniref:Uncharacterized protein n=1 Tax=Dallia pectoralis TaxID=75939 RepID=A0ACC2FGQ5_DALPE|nr:hypothetical protein DPEC_G00301050 [Dallia pectoralis]